MQIDPEWEYVADGVMGGVSAGGMRHEMYHGRMATVLRGSVSLANNGGFVQIAFDLSADGTAFDASGWDGIALTVAGNAEDYDIRLRTDQLSRPWQSFRTTFTAPSDWQDSRLPFDTFTPHKTEAKFDPARLRRIGVLAIGRAFEAEVAIAEVRLYRAN